MNVRYREDTDSLYISLSERQSADAQEVAPNVVIDIDQDGKIVGIDIYQYESTIVDLRRLEFEAPFLHAPVAV